jgi:hypothetical protein
LETFGECDGKDHRHHTDGRGSNSKPDDKPGKRMLTVKCYSPGDKAGNIQKLSFTRQKYTSSGCQKSFLPNWP